MDGKELTRSLVRFNEALQDPIFLFQRKVLKINREAVYSSDFNYCSQCDAVVRGDFATHRSMVKRCHLKRVDETILTTWEVLGYELGFVYWVTDKVFYSRDGGNTYGNCHYDNRDDWQVYSHICDGELKRSINKYTALIEEGYTFSTPLHKLPKRKSYVVLVESRRIQINWEITDNNGYEYCNDCEAIVYEYADGEYHADRYMSEDYEGDDIVSEDDMIENSLADVYWEVERVFLNNTEALAYGNSQQHNIGIWRTRQVPIGKYLELILSNICNMGIH